MTAIEWHQHHWPWVTLKVSFAVLCYRANTRLHYLKRLKRAGLPADRLAHWYISVIRPVVEYCAIVWHYGLSKNQTESTEAIQRRAFLIVYPTTASMPYWAALHYADLPCLSNRRDKLCRDFFQKLRDPSGCIHHLLPPARDSDLTSRLRRASTYPISRNRTTIIYPPCSFEIPIAFYHSYFISTLPTIF